MIGRVELLKLITDAHVRRVVELEIDIVVAHEADGFQGVGMVVGETPLP